MENGPSPAPINIDGAEKMINKEPVVAPETAAPEGIAAPAPAPVAAPAPVNALPPVEMPTGGEEYGEAPKNPPPAMAADTQTGSAPIDLNQPLVPSDGKKIAEELSQVPVPEEPEIKPSFWQRLFGKKNAPKA